MLEAIWLRFTHHVGCCGENAHAGGYVLCMRAPLKKRPTKILTGSIQVTFLGSAVEGGERCRLGDRTSSPMAREIPPVRGKG